MAGVGWCTTHLQCVDLLACPQDLGVGHEGVKNGTHCVVHPVGAFGNLTTQHEAALIGASCDMQ